MSMSRAFIQALRSVANVVTAVISTPVWLLVRVMFVDCTLAEFLAGRYNTPNPDAARPVIEGGLPAGAALLDLAKEEYHDQNLRLDQIQGKAKTLLTVAGLLATMMTVMVTRSFAERASVAALLVMLTTVALLLRMLRVSRFSIPRFDDAMASVSTESFDRARAADHLYSVSYNRGTLDFLVDLYRAASRSLSASLVIIFAIILFASMRGPGSSSNHASESQLSNKEADSTSALLSQAECTVGSNVARALTGLQILVARDSMIDPTNQVYFIARLDSVIAEVVGSGGRPECQCSD